MTDQTLVLSRRPRNAPPEPGTAPTEGVAHALDQAPGAPGGVPDRASAPLRGASGCPMHAMFKGTDGVSLPRKIAYMATGLGAYALFFVAFAYAVGFVNNLLVPKGIDAGTPGALIPSLIVNGLLLCLFVVQHTIMARPAFKRWWTRIIPEAMERPVFVAAASASLLLLYLLWRPLPGVLWSVDQPVLRWIITGVSLAGFGIVFLASLMINHFDLFGLRQTWYAIAGKPRPQVPFVLTGFYKIVRHPLMVGFLIAFWATPTMTVGHLFFSIMTTIYIFAGTAIEERDLVAHLGDTYREYRRNVRGFIPLPTRRTWRSPASPAHAAPATPGVPAAVPATVSFSRHADR